MGGTSRHQQQDRPCLPSGKPSAGPPSASPVEDRTGLVFDLDGTLLDSMFIWRHLGVRYLEQLGIRMMGNELEECLAPMSLVESVRFLKERLGLAQTEAQLRAGIEGMLRDAYHHTLQLKPGTFEFLRKVHETGRYRMCIATATPRHLVEPALHRLGIHGMFTSLLTVDEVGEGKHLPTIFYRAQAALGLPKDQILVFEDALYAIQTAAEAGFCVVAVAEKEEACHWSEINTLAWKSLARIDEALPLLVP